MSSSPATATLPADGLAALPRLGVGILHNASLTPMLRDGIDLVDYVAVIPDRFWMDEGMGRPDRFKEVASSVETVDWIAARRPLVGHSVGLSIGSAEMFDVEHVEQVARWRERYRMPWHSDHLSFLRVKGLDAHSEFAGVALNVPYDEEVLDLVAERVKHVQGRSPVPFLLENNVYYVDLPEQEMTEPEFLNRLTERTGCGILLDIHNVHCNAVNHGFDARAFVHALDLSRVVEVHVAGGMELAGMYNDAHSGPVADPVWEILDEVVAAAPNLCGITFEFEETYFPLLGAEGVRREVRKARDAWERHH